MSNPVKTLYLPDTMENWPWPHAINPHYEEVKAESNAWFHSFKASSAQSQYAFDKCDFALLSTLTYPRLPKGHLRTGCDLMNLVFAIDEYTDVEHEPVVHDMVDIVIDAMNNPHKPHPEQEVVLREITWQFWELAIKTASPTSQSHMIKSLTDFLKSVVQQAANRDNNTYCSIAAYLEFHHKNAGTQPAFIPIELDLNLPDEVFYHPIIIDLSVHISDLLLLDNTDLEGAMAWVLNYHHEVETNFLDGMKRVPSWDPDMDRQVQQYLDGLRNWPWANDCWNFEGGCYFGSKGLEIQKTHQVPLLPRVILLDQDTSLCQESVVVSLM